MIESLATVQARISQLQALVSGRTATTSTTSSGTTSGTSATTSAASALATLSAGGLTTDALDSGSTGSGTSFADLLAQALSQNSGSSGSQTSLASLLGLGSSTGFGSSGALGSSTGVASSSALASLLGLGSTSGQRSGTVTGAQVGQTAVQLARNYLGVPYRWGGSDPDTGLDCSGLTQLVYRRLGVSLPRVSRDQAQVGTAVASLDEAQPGDLVFFGEPIDHVGIYSGNGRMVEAPHTGANVRERTITETPTAIRRVVSSTTDASQLLAALSTGATATASDGSTASGSAVPTAYRSLFVAAGRRYGVDPALLAAVAKVESGYTADAVSGAGAQGLMQLMPGTARSLGVDALDPAQAVDGAARLLSGYLRDYHGRTDLALAAYNAGPGAVRRYGGVPPYSETTQYVDRVTRAWEALR